MTVCEFAADDGEGFVCEGVEEEAFKGGESLGEVGGLVWFVGRRGWSLAEETAYEDEREGSHLVASQ